MKEPVFFKNRDQLAVIDRSELIVQANEKRFAFFEVKNELGISESFFETKENAHLEVVVLQHISLELDTISSIRIRAGKDSSIKFTFIQTGAKRAHLEVETEVLGSGAKVEIRGLQYAKQDQKLSFQVNSRHAVPHTQSDLQVWCIANDEAHSLFNGTITIDRGAHHTEAYQKNKNLLLSDRATIDTFPKLFIWNDDVKCAHGSTVSQLDPDQFYYLQSRGIDQEAAEKMLLAGFMHQSFEWISDQATQKKLETLFGILEEDF
jgi:Fe-S cluster assembly protein SufD